MNQTYNIEFNPIQCTSKVFKELDAQDGFVYFLTDTKQMFMAKDGKFINMCGGVNIHYGTKEIEYENSGQAPDPNVTFSVDDLEAKEAPLQGDLILNSDGCFYKVETVEDEGISTKRLTLQGTGGIGGGGTGGGGVSSSYSINVVPQNNIFSSASEKMKISFQGIASIATENYISHVAFSIGSAVSESNPAFHEVDGYFEIGTLDNPKVYDIDLAQYKDLFSGSATTVYLNTTDVYGANLSKKFTIQIVDLSLKAEKDIIINTPENEYVYSCIVGGAKSGITEKKLIFNFYNEDNLNAPVHTQEQDLDSNFNGSRQVKLGLDKLNHGVYVMQVIVQAKISGTTTIIKSNILTHKIIRFVSGSSNALLAIVLPDKIEQYTNIPMYYLLASAEENKNYTLNITVDTTAKPSLSVTTNTLDSYTLYFESKGTYTLTVGISELGGLEQVFSLDVAEYTGDLPVIDPTDESLMLYLTPKGQSNNAVNPNIWKDYNGRYTGQLTDVYFSNSSGWLEEADGTSYLQLTSGGKLTIPDFYPFANDPTKISTTNSAMGQGMTIELDFEIDGVTDYDAELIKCISINQREVIQVGFSITGNKIKFYNSSKNGQDNKGALATLSIVEGKRIRLSFVIEPNNTEFPMCLSYFNGIVSGATIYGTDDSFVDSTASPAQLIVDSTHAQIKIYGIRFYTTALKDRNILNNFTASLPTLEERQARFDSNNVYNIDNEIDYSLVSSEHYDLQVPYMLISGGWKTDKDNDKWQILPADKVGQPGLPTDKKDYRMINVSVVYPKNEYFKNYKNYSYTNEFENGLGLVDNFGNKPKDKTGCIMYAQGTSSMEYPVKNLRLRFRNKKHYYTVRPNIDPVEIICMKADYMESSGSHNTGAANLVDDLYDGASLKSPGQVHFGPNQNNPDRKKIVTCIKGHPCLIFYSESGDKGTYQYVGKYNLNLDKATPEPFGFNHDDSDFGYLPVGSEYYAVQYDDDGDKFIGQEDPTAGGDYDDTKEGEELKVVQEGEKINSIHCFEFLDNAVPVCNFLRKPKAYIEDEFGNQIPDPNSGYYDYEETWYGTFQNKELDLVPGWTLGFESRYPEDRVGYHDADMLYPLASWLSELYYLKTEGSNGDGNPSQKDINEANARFKNEYQVYLNKDFLLFYYIVTEALLMADSRVKNMMIATWGKHTVSYKPLKYGVVNETTGREGWIVDEDADPIEKNVYEWYPIFYDMDTMLGLDNTGVDRFNYYDEDTDPSIYNGDEVLWNFVRDNLTLELDQMYRTLESAGLNVDIEENGNWSPRSILPYFNNNQANMANEAFYNGDAKYKYIRPAIDGYYDGLNKQPIKPGEAPYLYAAQGDRSITREYFVTNRIKFLRGKHNSNNFQTNDRITFRWYYPSGQEDDFKEIKKDASGNEYVVNHSTSVEAVPPSQFFNFESLQTCYAGVLLGANGNVIKERFNGEEKKMINVAEASSANGTEAYLLGISGLKDLGDLSDKYVQKFIMSGENKLRTLTFGNSHQDYYNPFWKPKEGNSTPIGISGCTYLKEFNLQNCSTYNAGLNFSNCPVIETILLTGSSTSGLVLPVNGILKELRLPTSITKLNINSHPYLTADKFSLGTYSYGPSKRIGESDGHYVDDFGYLTDVCIVNTPIDTYKIASTAVSLESYYFEGFNWEITGSSNDTQYVPTRDISMDSKKTYYIWNESQKSYVVASEEDFISKYNLIKEKATLVENGAITRIPILDYLSSKSAKKDSIPVTRESALSGTIVIKVPAKVNQFELYKKYHGMYPNVNIEYDEDVIGSNNLTKAYTIKFYNVPNPTNETEPYYSVLTDGSYTLKDLVSSSGPAGIAIATPSMQSTNTDVYEFTGKWKVVGTEIIYDMNTDFNTVIPKQDLRLEPIYNRLDRTYTVKFYNHLEEVHKTVEYLYLQVMSENANTPVYLGRDDSNLTEYERYAFRGWISEKDFKNNTEKPEIIKLDTRQVAYDMNLYPYYEVEDVRKVASSLEYFNITTKSVSFTPSVYNLDGSVNTSGDKVIDLGVAYVLTLKPEYASSISGKITLPNKDSNGNYITVLGSFGGASKITSVFFLEGNRYAAIGESSGNTGFYNCLGLKTIYFPTNNPALRCLGAGAFRLTNALTEITNLPNSIEYIGMNCFRGSNYNMQQLPTGLKYVEKEAFNGANVTATSMPLGVTQIVPAAFSGCRGLQIEHFGRQENSEMAAVENNIEFIGPSGFDGINNDVTKVYLHSSVKFLGDSCFDGYGSVNGITVYDSTGKLTNENKSQYFGSTRHVDLQEEYN